MSDLSGTFNPWEDHFTKGLYLAGVECIDEATAPLNWTKWIIPSYEYIYTENKNDAFIKTINYIKENELHLVGAVHDFTSPVDGKNYIYFPIKKL